jgi:hypothetical protein
MLGPGTPPGPGPEPELTEEGRRILDAIVADWNRGHPPGTHPPEQEQDQVLDQAQTALEPSSPTTPEILDNRDSRGVDAGQARSQRRALLQDRVRNEGLDPITEYLKNVPDEPDEEWS